MKNEEKIITLTIAEKLYTVLPKHHLEIREILDQTDWFRKTTDEVEDDQCGIITETIWHFKDHSAIRLLEREDGYWIGGVYEYIKEKTKYD